MRHLNKLVDIGGEGEYPRCELCVCDMHVSSMTARRIQLAVCREGKPQKVKYEANANSQIALEQPLSVYEV